MSKRSLLFLFFVFFTASVSAQKENNQLQFLAEAGFPQKGYNPGVGGYLKYLHGVGQRGQVSLVTGLSKFSYQPLLVGRDAKRSTLRTLPVLLGYKYNIKGFYLEPAAGFGELGGREDIGGDWARQSVGAFYWSMGVGFNYKRLDLGLRFQRAYGAENIDAGGWYNKTFQFFGVHVGYTLWQRPARTSSE